MKEIVKFIILITLFNHNTGTLCLFNVTSPVPVNNVSININKANKLYIQAIPLNSLGEYITYLPNNALYTIEVKHTEQALQQYKDTIDLRGNTSSFVYKHIFFPLVDAPNSMDRHATILFKPGTLIIDSTQTDIQSLNYLLEYLSDTDVHTLIKIHTSPDEDLQELADMRLHMIQKLFENSELVGFSSIISSSKKPQVAFRFGNFTYFLREAEAKPCFILVKTDQSKDIEISQAQPLKVNFYPKTFYNYYDGWHIYKLLSGCSYKVSINDKVFEYDFTNVTKDTVVSIFP